MNPNTKKFDRKQLEIDLIKENKFIYELLTTLALPTQFNKDEKIETGATKRQPKFPKNKTTRATSLMELKNRFDKLKESKSTHREKLQKKSLKKKLKLHQKNKPSKAIKTEPPIESKPIAEKLIFNADQKMVFSKINFNGLGKTKAKKAESNPKKLLEKVKEVNEKVERLKAAGETNKATIVRERNAWRNALARTQGEKVKDDPVLLKKSIKKLEQKKRSSKKKWDARLEGVEKAKSERQQKRTENIEKRKKDKKLKNMKKAAKKGRIIAGF